MSAQNTNIAMSIEHWLVKKNGASMLWASTEMLVQPSFENGEKFDTIHNFDNKEIFHILNDNVATNTALYIIKQTSREAKRILV
jgi:hypothetical protein